MGKLVSMFCWRMKSAHYPSNSTMCKAAPLLRGKDQCCLHVTVFCSCTEQFRIIPKQLLTSGIWVCVSVFCCQFPLCKQNGQFIGRFSPFYLVTLALYTLRRRELVLNCFSEYYSNIQIQSGTFFCFFSSL